MNHKTVGEMVFGGVCVRAHIMLSVTEPLALHLPLMSTPFTLFQTGTGHLNEIPGEAAQ